MNTKHFKRPLPILLALILALTFLTSCAPKAQPQAQGIKMSDTDYSNESNWLRFGTDDNKDVDIFAVYPTVTFSTEDADKPFVRLDSPLMLQSAEAWIDRVDEIILPAGNVYAPLYRQLNGAVLAELDNAGFTEKTFSTDRKSVV